MTDEPFEWVNPNLAKRARRLRLMAMALVPLGLLAYLGLGYAGFYFGSRYKPPTMAMKTVAEPAAPSATVSGAGTAKTPASEVAEVPATPPANQPPAEVGHSSSSPAPAAVTPAVSPAPQASTDSRVNAKSAETPHIINSLAKPPTPPATTQEAPAAGADAPADRARAESPAATPETARTTGKTTGEPRRSASRAKRDNRDRGPRLAAPAERWDRNKGIEPSTNPDAFQQWDEQERRDLARRATERDLFPFPPHGNSDERSYRALREGVVRRYLYD